MGGVGSLEPIIQTRVGLAVSFNNTQATSQYFNYVRDFNCKWMAIADEKQREELEPIPIPKYDLQLAAPYNPVRDFTY
jgi:hypothetical protein